MAIFFGDDFEYSDATIVYPTLDRVLEALSEPGNPLVAQVLGAGVNLKAHYSTPSQYLAALAQDNGPQGAGTVPGPKPTSTATASSWSSVSGSHRAPLAAKRDAATPSAPSTSSSASTGTGNDNGNGTGIAFPGRPSWDFLPHGFEVDEFPWWTGFYTSRPDFKQKFHAASALFRAASQLHTLARDTEAWFAQYQSLLVLWEGLSLVQHHDAMTGDAHDFVMDDWLFNYIVPGVANASAVASQAITKLGGPSGSVACLNSTFIPCDAIATALAKGENVTVTVHNSLGWQRQEVVELLVPVADLTVIELASGTFAAGQVMPAPADDIDAPPIGPAGTWYTLSFIADQLPPLGWRTYTIAPVGTGNAAALPFVNATTPDGSFGMANGLVGLSFGANGSLTSLSAWDTAAAPSSSTYSSFAAKLAAASASSRASSPSPSPSSSSIQLPFSADVLFYASLGGHENLWDFSTDASPNNTAQPFPSIQGQASVQLFDGPIVQEVRVVVSTNEGIRLRWRLLNGEASARLFVGTGPFNTSGPASKDSILRFSTPLTGNTPPSPSAAGYGPVWYADANGLELQRHALNWRPYYPGFYQDPAYPVACQYSPWTAGLFIVNSTNAEAAGDGIAVGAGLAPGSTPNAADGIAFGLVAANSMGGASLFPGSLETMLNRAVVGSDGTPAGAIRHATQEFAVMVSPSFVDATGAFRPLSLRMSNPVTIYAAPSTTAGEVSVPVWSPLGEGNAGLPSSVQLLSLQTLPPGLNVSAQVPPGTPIEQASVLLRLRHIYAKGEGQSTSETVELSTLLSPALPLQSAVELTADAARPLAQARQEQIVWQQAQSSQDIIVAGGMVGEGVQQEAATGVGSGSIPVQLDPIAIRTFLVQG